MCFELSGENNYDGTWKIFITSHYFILEVQIPFKNNRSGYSSSSIDTKKKKNYSIDLNKQNGTIQSSNNSCH